MEKTDDALWSRGMRGNRQYKVVREDWREDANRPLSFVRFACCSQNNLPDEN